MGIREEHIKDNIKNISISANLKNFKELGYWIRTIKEKVKKFEILKIKIIIDVDYFDNRREEEK